MDWPWALSTSSSTCRCLALLFVLLYPFDLIELYWRLNMSNISAWAHQESTEQRPSSFDELMVWAWAMIFSLEVRWLRKWGADHAQTWLGILDSHSAVIHVQWQSLHHIWLEKPMCYSCQIVALCHTAYFFPWQCDCMSLPTKSVEVKGDLAVVGTFTSAQIGSVNAAGKKNVDGNRLMAKLMGAMGVKGTAILHVYMF